MAFPREVKIVEVGPRDGLQNESKIVPTEKKIAFINALSQTGLKNIEVTSFVSPKWIPQFADNKDVYKRITKFPDVHYSVLVPNSKGFEDAAGLGVKEIAVFTTPSELFSKKNTNSTVAESMAHIKEIMALAKQQQIPVRAYISCVLGCPYEGNIPVAKVVMQAEALLALGCYEISFGDTIGVGTPLKTGQLLQSVMRVIPAKNIAVHFHDTYNQALANIYVALENGIRVIDSSIAGLGGCPYAKGATGNVATEDVVYMLHGMGIQTGVDFDKLLQIGWDISNYFKRKPQSKVSIAHMGKIQQEPKVSSR